MSPAKANGWPQELIVLDSVAKQAIKSPFGFQCAYNLMNEAAGGSGSAFRPIVTGVAILSAQCLCAAFRAARNHTTK